MAKLSIQAAVNKALLERPELWSALKKDLINGNAISREIHKDVEKYTRSKVKLNTITVAVKRFQQKMEQYLKKEAKSLNAEEINSKAPVIVHVYEYSPAAALYFSNLFADANCKDLVGMFMDDKHIYVAFGPGALKKITGSKAVLVEEFKDAVWFGMRFEKRLGTPEVARIMTILNTQGVEIFGMYMGSRDMVFLIPKDELAKLLAVLA